MATEKDWAPSRTFADDKSQDIYLVDLFPRHCSTRKNWLERLPWPSGDLQDRSVVVIDQVVDYHFQVRFQVRYYKTVVHIGLEMLAGQPQRLHSAQIVVAAAV